jgi:hypothetical protein
MAQMLEGVLINLLTAGLQRSGSLLLQKILRLRKIDKVLRGFEAQNPLFRAAIDDFIRVAGSYRGEYTEPLAAFLQELQKTGIIDSLAEAALVSRRSPALEAQFSKEFSVFLPQSEGADQLYRSIYSAFRVTFEELTIDRVLYHALITSNREIEERLNQIDRSLTQLTPLRREGSAAKFKEIEADIAKITRGLLQSYKTIRIETNRGPRKVEINKIYIAPKLSLRASMSHRRRMQVFTKLLHRDRLESRLGDDATAFEGQYLRSRSQELSTFTYSEVQSAFKRVVVLGDPGGGKSTLCQKLCFDLSKNAALAAQFPGNDKIEGKDQRIPLRVVLRGFEAAWVKDPQIGLLTYLERDLAHFCALERSEVRNTLAYLLESGRALLAFDGLDEILDTSKRVELVDRVTAFCNKYPLCPVIVTSRLVGYDDAPLPDEYEELVLKKFDDPEILDYVTKFMKVVADAKAAESKALAEKFLDQTAANAADLRRNPLMLGLMAWLFMASGDVPSNRPEIYKECSILMFERWDQRRGIMADENTDFDRAQLLIDLASRIYGNADLAGGVSKGWLETALKEQFESIYENRAKAFRATKKFVEFITGRAWVMTEIGDDIYTFTHQTFMEYYFALFLSDHFDSVAALLRSLRRRIVAYEWNEVTHLALQIKTFRSMKKQEEAIDLLGGMIQQARVTKQQTALIEFAARALHYLAPSEHAIRSFLSVSYAVALDRAQKGDVATLMACGDAAYASSERQGYVQERISEALAGSLQSGNDKVVLAVAPYVTSSFMAPQQRRRAELRRIHPQVFSLVCARAQAFIFREAEKSPVMAGMAWALYGRLTDSALRSHGLGPLYNFSPVEDLPSVDGLVALALRAGAWRQIGASSSRLSQQDAEKHLVTIGSFLLGKRRFRRSTFGRKEFLSPNGLFIWDQIYQGLRHNPRAVLGAILVRALCTSITQPKVKDGEHRLRTGEARRLRARQLSIDSELKLLSGLKIPKENIERAASIVRGEVSLLDD